MKILALLAVGSLLVVFVPDAHAAGFYKWVDKDGQEFFTNELTKVPPEYRKNAVPVETHEERVSVGDKPVNGNKASTAAKEGKEHKDKYGHGEEYWRKKAADLRLKLRDQQDEYELVLKQLEDQDKNPKKLSSKKKKSRSSLEKKKVKLEKDMAKTRRRLEVELPEEARRADAYPGWIRE